MGSGSLFDKEMGIKDMTCAFEIKEIIACTLLFVSWGGLMYWACKLGRRDGEELAHLHHAEDMRLLDMELELRRLRLELKNRH